MKRIFLFVLTNLAVMVVLGIIVSLLGVDRYMTANGINMTSLLIYAGITGFSGSLISLFFSKSLAKASVGAHVIYKPETTQERWLVDTIGKLARTANLPMPEVAIYRGAPNAFATGPSRSNALVAVSSGLLESMNQKEVEAVLGHELSHVKNGDMVTLTLIQGVLNTFVFFLARVLGAFLDQSMRRNHNESSASTYGRGMGYYGMVSVLQILFGILASLIVMAFSRQREFRADRGAAELLNGPEPMIAALQRLGESKTGALPQNMAAFGISGSGKLLSLFASHPPLEARIAALKAWKRDPEPFFKS